MTISTTTTIFFRNADEVRHTLTVYLAETPQGTVVADTGEVASGQQDEAVVLFMTGAHAFRCEIHPEQMRGTIVVR